jgi:uridine kinase
MKGDILVIEDNHRKAAKQVAAMIIEDIDKSLSKFIISVGGESGSGKSEIAESLKDELLKYGYHSFVFGQDDYFKLPPKTNERQREKDISWVGMQEVRLELLDRNLSEAVNGNGKIVKPLVDFNEDRIEEETVDLTDYKVLIAEGTYTSRLGNVNCRVFIDRNFVDTKEARKKRSREKQDEFLEQILTIEHNIISKHKSLSDIIITKTFNVYRNPYIRK